MGNWNINIQGLGCHHNNNPEIDADMAAADFVKTLKSQGHTIQSATFTYGGTVDLFGAPTQMASERLCDELCHILGEHVDGSIDGGAVDTLKRILAENERAKAAY
ncbi:hypothetical protein IAD21_00913 [Abditibacteriota bacterium]|nr:hypothetical protein IAD21_00913 [Abditibacteriota bacterium]